MKSVFVIGDSISIQYGPYLADLLKGRFQYGRKSGEEEALRDLDVPAGANGGDSSMVLRYLEALGRAGEQVADIMLVNCGLHDIKTDPESGERQVPLDRYKANLPKIVALARGLCDALVWVRTTPVDDDQHNSRATGFHRHRADQEAYNAAADAVMREHGVPMLDLCGFTAALGGTEVFCDHVHFTDEVRARQGAFIAGYLDALAATGRV
jgi:lysophospholipase L1-like esterase